MKKQLLIQKSTPKNKKLSTGVTKLSFHSEKVVTPYKEEKKQDKDNQDLLEKLENAIESIENVIESINNVEHGN